MLVLIQSSSLPPSCADRFVSFPTQPPSETSRGDALRSTVDLEHSRACNGQFDEEYHPIRAVGKGAFGFVWQACRRSDGQEVRPQSLFIYI